MLGIAYAQHSPKGATRGSESCNLSELSPQPRILDSLGQLYPMTYPRFPNTPLKS
jgi:hypothetical protein